MQPITVGNTFYRDVSLQCYVTEFFNIQYPMIHQGGRTTVISLFIFINISPNTNDNTRIRSRTGMLTIYLEQPKNDAQNLKEPNF